jgi:hypothetical protein
MFAAAFGRRHRNSLQVRGAEGDWFIACDKLGDDDRQDDCTLPNSHTNVGQCIYCGEASSPLTREHVLPRGLGGFKSPAGSSNALVLQQASCESCQVITQSIEDDCLSGQFWPIRSRLKFNRKDRRPLSVPVQLVLALQLLSLRASESMGNHDSNVVGAGRVG